ncbi:DUF421 domain-containing protein [Altererythrobacter aquiaggeris]|uniref:DUF421 domain-containing protein n=1 Tax=Aestuarierythrobacter aquiaggeris TaxID=1898396 RepID=UPI003017AF01
MFLPDYPTSDALVRGFVLGTLAMIWVVALIRVNGLRSLSKMTNFDFVMTIAMGSLVAGGAQASEWNQTLQIGAAMLVLFVFQNIVARLRRSSQAAEHALQNNAVYLMKNGKICEAAMAAERVTLSDLYAKLREANALEINKVKAVVLETTGDISVLHGDDDPDAVLTKNIRVIT